MNSSPPDNPANAQTHPPSGASDLEADVLLHPVSRRKAAIWTMVFYYPALVLVLARNIVLVPLYIKYIGKEEYFAWLSTGNVLMQLTSVDFGLMGVLLQQVAVAYGSRERRQLERLIGTGLILAAAISLVMGAVTAVISPLLPRLIEVAPQIGQRLTSCFLIVAVANAVQLFGFATGGLLKSLQRTFLAGTFYLLSEVASLVGTLYLIFAGWGLYAIALGLVLRAVVEVSGTAISFLWISLRHLKLRYRWEWREVRRLWRFSVYQFLTQIAGRIKTSIDTLLIGMFVSTEAGGAYALTTRAHDTARMFSVGVAGAMTSPLAHLHGEGQEHRFKEIVFSFFKVITLIGALGYAGIIALNQTFMLLWVGPGIYLGTVVNAIAAAAGIAYLLSVVPYDAIFTRGGFAVITKVVWVEVVARMAVMVALLYAIGVVGAPSASLFCQVFGVLIPLTWINARDLHITSAEFRSLIGSMLKLLAGPILLAFVFAMVLHDVPITCAYVVAPSSAEAATTRLNEQFPSETGVRASQAPDASRIYVQAYPALQEQISTSLSGLAKPASAPARAWPILIAEACLFLALCLIYTWIVDRRLARFLFRGGSGTAV